MPQTNLAEHEGLKAPVSQASYSFMIELFAGHCEPAEKAHSIVYKD
jgi:hypothetical protein